MSHIFQFSFIGKTPWFTLCSYAVVKSKEQEVKINRFALKVLSWFEQRFGPKQKKNPTPIKEAHQVFLVHTQFSHPEKKINKEEKENSQICSAPVAASAMFSDA